MLCSEWEPTEAREPGAHATRTRSHAARMSRGAECHGIQHARSLRCPGTLMSVFPSQYLLQAALCLQPSQTLPLGSSMETGSICLKTKGLKSTVHLSGSREHSFYSLVPGGETSGILGNRCVECSIWGRRQRLGKTWHRSLCKGPC